MRAAEQAHPYSIVEARALLTRAALAAIATAMLLLVWHPAVLHAQDSAVAAKAPAKPTTARRAAADTATTTHVVKAGETLWSIATRYYGDGHEWHSLAKRNGILTTGETAIRIGMKLVVPSRRTLASVVAVSPAVAVDTSTPKAVTAPAAAPAPAPTTPVTTVTKPKGALATQTAEKADAAPAAKATKVTSVSAGKRPAAAPSVAAAPAATVDSTPVAARAVLRPQVKAERMLTRGPARIGLVETAEMRAARASSEPPTVFANRSPDADAAVTAVRVALRRPDPAPRTGEFIAAPFAVVNSKWAQAGTLVRRVDDANASTDNPAHVQLADAVEITLPEGTKVSVGDRFLTVRQDASIGVGSHVAIPTAVVQVTRVDAGKPVRAYVRSVVSAVTEGQRILPLEGTPPPSDAHAAKVSGKDVETSVTWIADGELMPTLHSYVVLGAGEAEGVKPGDEFALTVRVPGAADARVARVRVVRTGASGSTGIVVHQDRPEIARGMKASRIAKAP